MAAMPYVNFRLDTDADGIATVTWDMPGRSMNVFDLRVMDELDAIFDAIVADDAITGVVIASGKETFSGGADLAMLDRMLGEFRAAVAAGQREEATRRLYAETFRLGDLFRRIETCGKPVVAAINGTCLGGAFELALACHGRIAADGDKVRVGLPEVRVGLLPGAGGTQRVARLVNTQEALTILLKGEQLKPLDLSGLPAIVADFKADGVQAVAISFLHSYADPSHEEAAMAELRRLWPEVSAVASHQITREWREYERTNTAVLSAYVQPIAERYLSRLAGGLKEKGLKGSPYIMQSNCGVDSLESVSKIPITMVESGPASGFWGAAELGKLIGEPNVLALDIGGTTAKCSLIEDGEVKIKTD